MANYECAYRTNYFHVKNMDLFKEFITLAKYDSEDLVIYPDGNDKDAIMIGGYGSPSFFPKDFYEEGGERANQMKSLLKNLGLEDLIESEDDIFFEVLAACVRADDAILYKEGGNEKLRYVSLNSIVITSGSINWIDIDKYMLEQARAALGNKEWKTQIDY